MNAVVWPRTDAYRGFTREALLARVQAALAGRCESAWLFGSFARGEERPGSDLDIIVVARTGRPMLERARDFDALWQIFPAVDLLVYTPEEFVELSTTATSAFMKSVRSEMLRLV